MKIWALLGAHRGDNDQVLALAEAIGLPFERKQLSYNGWRHLRPRLLGATLRSLSKDSRAAIAGDAPDLTISAGLRSVPVVQALRRRSAGKMRSVHVGYPRISPAHFDLVLATPQYPIPDHPRLLRIPFALTRARDDDLPDRAFQEAYPAPRRLLVLGGPAVFWRDPRDRVSQALDQLLDAADREGGSVLVVGSPRTPRRTLARVTAAIAKARAPAVLVPTEGPPSYGSLLASADNLFVTADSVSMVSDAIATGKPVGLIGIQPTLGGRLAMSARDWMRPGAPMRPHDLRCFWEALEDEALVGTVGAPRSGGAPALNHIVAKRVKALLNGGSGASR